MDNPKISQLIDYLQEIAPLHLQEQYDNAGLLVGDKNAILDGVLISLDSTEDVVEEAISLGCNLIVAHHPIIFSGLKKLTGSNYIERTVIKAIKNDIAIYAIHTNLDNVFRDGVNEMIAHKIGLQNLRFLRPKAEVSNEEYEVGSGMIGELESSLSAKAFLQHLKDAMEVSCVKYTDLVINEIKTVAVCGGSGGFLLSDAIKAKADIFITSDYKYHEFFDANGEVIIADIGHYESEQFTIALLHGLITKKFSNFAAHCTKVNTNPVNYL